MHVVSAFIADAELPPGVEPADGPFNHPPITPESGLRLDPSPGDSRSDAAPTQSRAAKTEVVTFVRMHLTGASPWTASLSPNRWNGVDHCQSHRGVMRVRSRDCRRKRYPSSVNHDMML